MYLSWKQLEAMVNLWKNDKISAANIANLCGGYATEKLVEEFYMFLEAINSDGKNRETYTEFFMFFIYMNRNTVHAINEFRFFVGANGIEFLGKKKA